MRSGLKYQTLTNSALASSNSPAKPKPSHLKARFMIELPESRIRRGAGAGYLITLIGSGMAATRTSTARSLWRGRRDTHDRPRRPRRNEAKARPARPLGQELECRLPGLGRVQDTQVRGVQEGVVGALTGERDFA